MDDLILKQTLFEIEASLSKLILLDSVTHDSALYAYLQSAKFNVWCANGCNSIDDKK